LEIAEEILAADPYDESGNQLIVRVAKKQQNFRLMALAYETLCVHSPNNTTYLYELGEAYLLDQRYTEAREVFNQILQLSPGHDGAQKGLAKIVELSGMAAQWRLSETVHFKPEAVEHRAPLFNTSEFTSQPVQMPKGPLPFDSAIIDDPVSEQGTIVGRLNSALEAVENQALHDLGKFEEWQQVIEQREADKIRHLEHQIALAPADPEINFRLGVINIERFHLEQARQQLEVAAASKNLEFTAYALLALCLLHESIVHRPVEGPSRADFAWFV
jgi:tetratricopeptide (TPR) repeat protein